MSKPTKPPAPVVALKPPAGFFLIDSRTGEIIGADPRQRNALVHRLANNQRSPKKKQREKPVPTKPASHLLDRRVDQILGASDGPDDELMRTRDVAAWLGVSNEWLEIGRSKGYGPPFERLASRLVRYRRGAIRKYLKGRSFKSTAGYSRKPRITTGIELQG